MACICWRILETHFWLVVYGLFGVKKHMPLFIPNYPGFHVPYLPRMLNSSKRCAIISLLSLSWVIGRLIFQKIQHFSAIFHRPSSLKIRRLTVDTLELLKLFFLRIFSSEGVLQHLANGLLLRERNSTLQAVDLNDGRRFSTTQWQPSLRSMKKQYVRYTVMFKSLVTNYYKSINAY